MLATNVIILTASVLVALQSWVLAFQHHRITLPVRTSIQSSLRLATDDDVQRLLEKARKLREEAATMSGKTLQEVEDEAKEQKLAQKRIVENARKEREQSSSASRSSMQITPVPDDAKAQNEQAAAAVERAFKDGITRQTVRFALIGQEEAMSGELNEFPGGAKQIYRECGRPLTESLLRELRITPKKNGSIDENEQITSSATPVTVTAEDIWDFDGSAIISTNYVKALVFPNTDVKYLKDIEAIDKEVGPDGLFLLVNPFWRNVESWGFNILAPNGKKRAQEVIFDKGYQVTYAVLRFSVRGEDCVAVKSYPYDWQMYAYREDPSWFNQQVPLWLGKSEEEPTSSQFTELLNSRPEFKMSKNMRQMQRMMGNDDQ
mmetsp:Transcript_3901/g.6007  ORF Transcript_3901/g.6007 Transcript_3901/m.6007 type:complete len:376 (+) Transcript_3901:103-1230(+)